MTVPPRAFCSHYFLHLTEEWTSRRLWGSRRPFCCSRCSSASGAYALNVLSRAEKEAKEPRVSARAGCRAGQPSHPPSLYIIRTATHAKPRANRCSVRNGCGSLRDS